VNTNLNTIKKVFIVDFKKTLENTNDFRSNKTLISKLGKILYSQILY